MMNYITKLIFAFIAIIGLTLSTSQVFALNLWTDYGFGSVSGYQQIANGDPSGSSQERPTFSELGIKHSPIFEAGVNTSFLLLIKLHLMYQNLSFKGSETLDQELVTNKTVFPVGTNVNMNSYYKLFHITAGLPFNLLPKISLNPSVGFVIMRSNYSINDNTDTQSTSKNITTAAPELKLNAAYIFSPEWQLHINLHSTTPGSNLTNAEANSGLFYFPKLGLVGIKPAIFLKAGYIYLEYKDNKQNNDMHINYGSFLAGGISLSI